MCRKKPYCSRSAVLAAHRSAGFRYRAYQCPECSGLWHLTNADKSDFHWEPRLEGMHHVRRSGVLGLAPVRSLEELEAIAARMRGLRR